MLPSLLALTTGLGIGLFGAASAADNFIAVATTMLILARPSHQYTTRSIKSDRFCHSTGHHFQK